MFRYWLSDCSIRGSEGITTLTPCSTKYLPFRFSRLPSTRKLISHSGHKSDQFGSIRVNSLTCLSLQPKIAALWRTWTHSSDRPFRTIASSRNWAVYSIPQLIVLPCQMKPSSLLNAANAYFLLPRSRTITDFDGYSLTRRYAETMRVALLVERKLRSSGRRIFLGRFVEFRSGRSTI